MQCHETQAALEDTYIAGLMNYINYEKVYSFLDSEILLKGYGA
jgi:hypothetical protein